VLRVVGSIIDITDRKSAEAELRRADEELREASRRKDQFLAILAHELRNPLAPVRNALQILKLAEDDARKVAATRGMMERQVSHMVRLIDDLMDVSRLTRDRLELQRADTTIAQVLDAAIETCRPGVEAAGHHLEVTLPAESLPVHADRLRLAQVFGNLISNSTKFMDAGGTIRIDARREGDEAVIAVTDSGAGIAAEDLPRLFEMFTQVRREHGSRNGGLGIGLALVRSLVTLHGGSVSASSPGLGAGATFVVRLPIAEPRDPGALPPRRSLPPAAEVGSLRIVVADDNLDAAQSLATLLEGMGHEVRVAGNGREAVAVTEAFRPAIVFMDLSMPHLDGLDAARQIRSQPWGKDLVICALTGFSHDQDRQRSLDAGMDLHLVKPVDPEALAAVLVRS
jgi:CheY-like chemotaxis protein